MQLTRVEVVSKQQLTDSMVKQIESGFKARLGEEVQIDVQQVAEIAAEKSGKYRYVISKVAQ